MEGTLHSCQLHTHTHTYTYVSTICHVHIYIYYIHWTRHFKSLYSWQLKSSSINTQGVTWWPCTKTFLGWINICIATCWIFLSDLATQNGSRFHPNGLADGDINFQYVLWNLNKPLFVWHHLERIFPPKKKQTAIESNLIVGPRVSDYMALVFTPKSCKGTIGCSSYCKANHDTRSTTEYSSSSRC